MKMLSINLARTVWLFPSVDLNPKGLNLYPILIPLLVGTYKFSNYPTSKDDLDDVKGVKFEKGEFINSEGKPISISFTIYNDGIVADTRSSTNDSDSFLVDAFNRISEHVNVPNYKQILRARLYHSQIYISTEKSLELINPKVKEISSYLNENVEGHGKVNYEVGGISFWPDQTHPVNPVPFTLERASNTPFSEKRYYSAAALQTDKHVKLLEKLEEILGS